MLGCFHPKLADKYNHSHVFDCWRTVQSPVRAWTEARGGTACVKVAYLVGHAAHSLLPGLVKLLLESVRLLLASFAAHAGRLELLTQVQQFLLVQSPAWMNRGTDESAWQCI